MPTTDALDFISLDSAKNWLSIDTSETEWDEPLTRLIKTAVDWVENYTSYQFYQREITVYSRQDPFFNPNDNFPPIGSGTWVGRNGIKNVPDGVSIYLFPVTINSVKDKNNADAYYSVNINPLKLLVYTQPNCVISLTTGYPDNTTIPPPLLDACYKLITYLFENRDMYNVQFPTDIQMLINQYRRAII
jgi:hypothetical protein